MKSMIQNPILRGFNPDPSITRVGEDYFIATSTFEWYPGVQIHHSKDLVHWQLVTRPLRRKNQLDMMGEYNACGIWAPCLSFDNGVFYLIYTNVVDNGTFENYLVTTDDILGDWSDPIYLNSRGFDTSLFHAPDGKKWYLCADVQSIPVNAVSNFKSTPELKENHWHRFSKQFEKYDLGELFFRGISLQEFDPVQGKLVGDVHKIFKGTELGITEAPHLFLRNGYHYLMVAEGGTGFEHAVTFARSKEITGPYEVHPANPILTSWGTDAYLTRAGHADMVETQTGETYMVHLCSRSIARNADGSGGYSILGRETGIQKMEWREDDWLWLAAEGNTPLTEVEAPDLPAHPFAPAPIRDDFDATELGIAYQWLRGDYLEEIASLKDRPGWLRLFGKQTVLSRYQQGLIARRQEELDVRVETAMDFAPKEFGQMAGLLAFYNLDSFYYLYKSVDEAKRPYLAIMTNVNGDMNMFATEPVWLDDHEGTVYLRITEDFDAIQFSYSFDGETWLAMGKALDAKVLSDEFNNHGGAAGFTGNFFAIACHDPVTKKVFADFDYFDYEEL